MEKKDNGCTNEGVGFGDWVLGQLPKSEFQMKSVISRRAMGRYLGVALWGVGTIGLGFSVTVSSAMAQVPAEKIDTEMIEKIQQEGMERSKVMDTLSYLTDVYGPRLTGSPMTKVAGEWTVGKLTEWGLANAHLEAWGPFGRGWVMEGCSVNLVEPNFSPLIAYPKAWSPSTAKTVRGEPIYLDAETTEDLEKYRGKLGRAIVLLSPAREVKPLFEAPAARQTDQQLLELANADVGRERARPNVNANAGGRSAIQVTADKWQFCYDEGAAVVIEPGRGDGGTVFVSQATMPRLADARGEGIMAFMRGPRPWAVDAPAILPQVTMAVEHYNRLVRMIQRDAHPVLEIDLACRYVADDLNCYNVVAEIPGSDLKDEVVMLGGHFDSWHSATGATDNGVGSSVAMEAVRILQAVGAKPRRTIRIGLWTGEEQGLLGSRAYVQEHFGKSDTPRSGMGGRRGEGGERPKPKFELTAEHEKISCYFNLDNGTGKVRGVYLQGNEMVRPIFRTWLAPFASLGATTLTASNTGGTDHLSFDGIGIPGFQFIQDPMEYDTRTHHSSMDTFERVQEEDAKQASVIMAAFVYNAAMRDEKLPRKPLQGEVVQRAVSEPAPAAAASGTETTPQP